MMIKLDPYTTDFLNEYWEKVNEKVDSNTQDYIMNSFKKYLPSDFLKDIRTFKDLILVPFPKLKYAHKNINKSIMETECFNSQPRNVSNMKSPYLKLYSAYNKVANAQKNKTTIRVRIVENTGLTVCPYCNRDYINSRGRLVSGAQLDHFFNRSDYPIFALCLYNLVPVCGNCNRVKSSRSLDFASPFDDSIDWNNDIIFSFNLINTNVVEIKIDSKGYLTNNIEAMKIKYAYQVHKNEVSDLLENKKTYSKTQSEEFKEILHKFNLTDKDIKSAIFGPKITHESMKVKPLVKMMSDLHRELDIYKDTE